MKGALYFPAFEFSRKLSKGHAEFWGIEPEDVSWESLGAINLVINLERFDYPVQISLKSVRLIIMKLLNYSSPSICYLVMSIPIVIRIYALY